MATSTCFPITPSGQANPTKFDGTAPLLVSLVTQPASHKQATVVPSTDTEADQKADGSGLPRPALSPINNCRVSVVPSLARLVDCPGSAKRLIRRRDHEARASGKGTVAWAHSLRCH